MSSNTWPVEQRMTLRDVVTVLRLNSRTIWRRVAEGKLAKPIKDGGRVFWFVSDIAKYEQQLRDKRGE